jgi:hypothetical protein
MLGAPIGQSSLGNDSFIMSSGRSVGTNGGGLANKISLALSRVVWNRQNNNFDDEDELADLI